MEGTFPLGSSCVDKFGGRKSASKSEESGWTQYFEDFSAAEQRKNDTEDDDIADSSFIGSPAPSLISDAASPPTPTYKQQVLEVEACSKGGNSSLHRVNVKKNKTNKKKYSSCVDLEDTASSPVSSPKVRWKNL